MRWKLDWPCSVVTENVLENEKLQPAQRMTALISRDDSRSVPYAKLHNI